MDRLSDTRRAPVSGTAKPEAIVQPRLCVKSVHLNQRRERARIEKRQLLRMPLLEQLQGSGRHQGASVAQKRARSARGTLAASGCQQITSERAGLRFPSSFASPPKFSVGFYPAQGALGGKGPAGFQWHRPGSLFSKEPHVCLSHTPTIPEP